MLAFLRVLICLTWLYLSQAHVTSFIRESATRDADGFGALVGQLSAEEMIVVRRVLQEQS